MKIPNQQPLNLLEALKLNSVLGKYLEGVPAHTSTLELAKIILKRIEATPKDYLECISIFMRVPAKEIDLTDTNGALMAFVQGLTTNRVLELNSRLKILGRK
jgi:hypothetical protein